MAKRFVKGARVMQRHTYETITPTGTRTTVSLANEATIPLHVMQGAVGGYIEILHLDDGRLMVVNEDGAMRRMPYNHAASMIARRPIVGTVIVCAANMID